MKSGQRITQMIKARIIATILTLGSVIVFGQKPKPRPKPKPRATKYAVKGDTNYACVAGPSLGLSPKPISGGILNSKAISLPEPALPEPHSEGVINVQVLIDEEGNVAAASAVSGPLLLKAAAVAAARKAKFFQTRLSGRLVKVSGILTYDFAAIRRGRNGTVARAKAGRNKKLPKVVSGGVMNGKAINLPKPAYPPAALALGAEGVVDVQVLIDEEGKVIYAAAVSGSPLLRGAALNAAKEATFEPMSLGGEPIRVTGSITYIFHCDLNWLKVARALSRAEAGRSDRSTLRVIESQLPDDFRDEKIEINSLAYFSSDTGSDREELKERATGIIESIREKLLNDPVNSWQFNFRVTLERIKGSINDDSSLAMHLLRLRELISSPPEGIGGEITRDIKSIADYAGRFAFTDAERENILLAVK